MRALTRVLVGVLLVLMLVLILVLGYLTDLVGELVERIKQPRLTAGVLSRNDRRDVNHDPPEVGGVRSIEPRHGPISRPTPG
jgi:hypothetical protein